MIDVVILGFGNVGSHLFQALSNSDTVKVIQIYARDSSAFRNIEGTNTTTQLSELKKADLYLLAVPDDAIGSLSAEIPFKDRLVAHVSGGVAIEVLNPKNRRAVFYPLQSFTKGRKLDYDNIPLCIEAAASEDLELLKQVGHSFTTKVEMISSEERVQLHLAAVFVNNYVNHLYHISETLLAKRKLPFDLLTPLILETAKKMEDLPPTAAQTGPALRNDTNTIEKHLSLLDDPKLKEIYLYFCQAIQTTHHNSDHYGKKL